MEMLFQIVADVRQGKPAFRTDKRMTGSTTIDEVLQEVGALKDRIERIEKHGVTGGSLLEALWLVGIEILWTNLHKFWGKVIYMSINVCVS